MLNRLLLLIVFSIAGITSQAQLADGSIAPDFTATDIDGVEHNLYDLLAEGKTVVMDVSATWCPPCWSYHQAGHLEQFMHDYGPDGSDEAMVLFIEGDISTSMDDLMGNTSESMGNWIAGTNYPIIDNAGINSMYQVIAFPTVYMICPDRRITRVGAVPSATLASNMGTCATQDIEPEPAFRSDLTSGCGDLEVQFEDTSWPRPAEWAWDFGDGTTSNERNPSHSYDAPGDYEVSLTVTNQYGTTTEVKPNAIIIGDGFQLSNVRTGMESNELPGSGGAFFPGGHQGMIFDALSDFVLSSATVYSDKADWRTFVVTDASDVLISRRDVYIEEGEHRIQLNMQIPEGTDYRIGMWSDAHLYRTNTGGGYPHIVDDVVNIKTSTVTSAGVDPDLYFYYLYDWKVRPVGCSATPSSVEDNAASVFTLYPNPAVNQITIESSVADLSQISIMDISGREIKANSTLRTNAVDVDVAHMQSGLYFITVGGLTQKFYRQ